MGVARTNDENQPQTHSGALRRCRRPAEAAGRGGKQQRELRKTFDSFVGETFFGQMLQSMRKTVGKPAYFHGGRAEEIFTQQLDQVLADKMANASATRSPGRCSSCSCRRVEK